MSDDAPYHHVVLERYDLASDAPFFTEARALAERAARETTDLIENYWLANPSPYRGPYTHLRWMTFASRAAYMQFRHGALHRKIARLTAPHLVKRAVGDIDVAAARLVSPPADPGEAFFCRMALFRPKAEFEPALLAEAARVVDRIRREVPGVIGFFFEPNAAPDAEGWRYASLHRFVSRASYADYDRHPLHHALKDLVMARTVELATGDLDTTTAARLSRKEQ